MRIALVFLLGSMVAGQTGSTMPPESERQLAREIYQEMIAVKSGYTTGSTTPVAVAVRRRLRAAGFPDADTLRKVFADDEVKVTIVGDVSKGPPSPMRDDLMTAVSSLTADFWPGVQAVPMMVMGATDGLYLRPAGIPTYGVQGLFYDRDDIRFHGRDERVKVESFYESQTFLYELVKQLTSPR